MSKEEIFKRLQEIVDMSKVVNYEHNGRPDCKNCSIQEILEEFIEEARDEN